MASRASLASLASLASRASLAQMKMKAPGACVYAHASQSLMKDTASVLERELWGLWEPFALWEAQVQNQIRAFVAQAFASGPWVRVGFQNQIQAFAGLWVAGL